MERGPYRKKGGGKAQRGEGCWSTYYQLGSKAAKLLPTNYKLDEIAVILGMSRQAADMTCKVALGKLIFNLKKAGVE